MSNSFNFKLSFQFKFQFWHFDLNRKWEIFAIATKGDNLRFTKKRQMAQNEKTKKINLSCREGQWGKMAGTHENGKAHVPPLFAAKYKYIYIRNCLDEIKLSFLQFVEVQKFQEFKKFFGEGKFLFLLLFRFRLIAI